MSNPTETLRLMTLHDQEQEWAECKTWFRSHTTAEMMRFFLRINPGTKKAMDKLTEAEVAAVCRLAVLAFCEVASKEAFKEDRP